MGFVEALLGYSGRVKIGEVTVDASMSEQHSIEGDVTEHPVEEGADISDHYRVLPRTLQIEGKITNTPIATGFPGQTLINSVGSAVSGGDPVLDAWNTVNGYFDNSEIITISTSLQEYPKMALTSFTVLRDAASGQVLGFSATAKRLKVVTTETTEPIVVPKTTPAAKKKAKGRKPPKAAKAGQNKSALAKLADKGEEFLNRPLI